jgi:hypothetical protein
MAIKEPVLGYGNSKIEIVDHGGIDFPMFEPSVGCLGCKNDGIFIGKTSLPATKR